MRTQFGTTLSGEPVEQVTLKGGGLTAQVLTYGASLRNLRLQGHAHSLVLGFDTLRDYENHGRYFGATVGRFANRIANGRFPLDGTTVQTDQNFLEKHTLHGGTSGLGTKVWTITSYEENQVVMGVHDSTGANGFPGECLHSCSYTLHQNGGLSIAYSSQCDQPTITSLAHHSYFNLDGTSSCLDHIFQIDAQSYLPVDGELIPTGEIRSVDNTEFDFREPKKLRSLVNSGTIYDHNFCLASRQRELTQCAIVSAPKSGISMKVWTTEPGLQFYAGHGVNIPVPGLDNARYGPCAGFALETQIWPDAPNHANFPSAILRPDKPRNQTTQYRFSK